jgi:hypothetical protein
MQERQHDEDASPSRGIWNFGLRRAKLLVVWGDLDSNTVGSLGKVLIGGESIGKPFKTQHSQRDTEGITIAWYWVVVRL